MSLLPPVVVEFQSNAQELLAKLGQVDDHLAKLGKNGGTSGEMMRQGLGRGMEAVGATAAGVGALLVHVAGPAEEAQKKLEVAVRNTGGSFEEFHGRVAKVVEQQAKLGRNSADTEEALAKLTTATGSTPKALDDMKLASEIAAFKHESLADAASQVIKMHAGSSKAFKEFGISVQSAKASVGEVTSATKAHEASGTALAKATQHLGEVHQKLAGVTSLSVSQQIELQHANEAVMTATENNNAAAVRLMKAHADLTDVTATTGAAMDQVFKKVQGQAAAQSDTFEGKLRALRATAENFGATLGAKVGPALSIAGPAMAGLGGLVQSNLIPALAGAIAKTAVWSASMIAGAAEAAVGWALSMAGMIASSVAAGIGMMIPFLPVIAVIAAIGIAAYVLYRNWDTIWSAIKAIAASVWDFLKWGFHELVSAFENFTPLGQIIKHWSAIEGFVRTLPGKISSAASGMWDGITGAFKTAINAIIRGWNSLDFKLPAIDYGPVHLGGFTLGTPDIPYLAEGGVATRATLAMIGEAGPEAVVPLSRYQQGGGGNEAPQGDVVLQVDGQTFARIARAQLLQLKAQGQVALGLG